VFAVPDSREVVAKIYEPGPPADYEIKLTWMIEHPPSDPTIESGPRSIAWPTELLYDREGEVIGVLMPRIEDGVSLRDLFDRMQNGAPAGFDWRALHQIACNLAAALAAVHERGYVVGNLNCDNILITPGADVALIDLDAIQVRVKAPVGEMVFRCPAGTPEYMPPEFQGRALSDQILRPEHDAFALSVLVFQLLMEGSHPFDTRQAGTGDPGSLEASISGSPFPYHARSATRARDLPPGPAVIWDALYPAVVDLFERCFVDGQKTPERRPGPAAWRHALDLAIRSLVTCPRGHVYVRGARICPWCQAIASSPPPPSVTPQRRQHGANRPIPRRPARFSPARLSRRSSDLRPARNHPRRNRADGHGRTGETERPGTTSGMRTSAGNARRPPRPWTPRDRPFADCH
jgi:DNA-binding helix-hairpin-helix protein with protein kinase domain